jgi:hypothetical protein
MGEVRMRGFVLTTSTAAFETTEAGAHDPLTTTVYAPADEAVVFAMT